jgi:hypothetical protein
MSFPKLVSFVVSQSILHPRTSIVLPNPGTTIAPTPWWISLLVLIIGIACWCLAEHFTITGLSEAARAMVYLPLGNMFGMGTKLYEQVKKKDA